MSCLRPATDPFRTAAPIADDILLGRVTQGVRLAHDGRFEKAIATLEHTRHDLHHHPLSEMAPVLPGLLVNLGLAQSLIGRFGSAEKNLYTARQLAEERDLPLLELAARHNLGCLALHRNDAPSAIAVFLDLAPHLPTTRREALHVDLAEALLTEGLVKEAADTLAESPRAPSSPTALLIGAKLRLLEGDHRYAHEVGRRIRLAHGRGSVWHRLARRLEHTALTPRRSHATHTGTALALRAPLSPIARHPSAPPRISPPPGPWSAHTVDDPHLVRSGLEQALTEGRIDAALEWSEFSRTWASALVPGHRVPGDPALTSRYRQVQHRIGASGAAAQARDWESARWRDLYAPHTRRALHPGGMSEAQDAHSTGGRPGRRWRPIIRDLMDHLGDRAFVHYVHAKGQAVALIATAGNVYARTLGPASQVARMVAWFTGSDPADPGHAEAAAQAGMALLGPVLPVVGDSPLVLAWDAFLDDPPWSALPALCGRPVVLVPTARSWLERRRTPELKRVVLAGGTAPAGAAREVTELAKLYPHARVLTGEQAVTHSVLNSFEEADLVHLTGHGHVPDRAPMLASVGLADGPLLACDLIGLPRVPSVVTLSTCWNGRAFTGGSGPPVGFVGTLLDRGAHTVVASPVPVRDIETGSAMRRFHRALASGTPAPEAVADHLGRAGFCCFGG